MLIDMKNEIIYLNSVGCVMIDGIVYAMFADGDYDQESGIALAECDEEWFECLSFDDMSKIKNNLRG